MSNDTTFEQAQAAFDSLETAIHPSFRSALDTVADYMNKITEQNHRHAKRSLLFQEMFEENQRAMFQHGYKTAVNSLIQDPIERELAISSSPFNDSLFESVNEE